MHEGGSKVEAGGEGRKKGVEEVGRLIYTITLLDEECKIWDVP